MKTTVHYGILGVVLLLLAPSAAAQLEDYPAPFIRDGKLTDSLIVIGSKAAVSDALAVSTIIVALQAAAVTKEVIYTDTAVPPTVSEGTRVGQSSLTYNKRLFAQNRTLTEQDLTTVLAPNRFKFKGFEVDYRQELRMGPAALLEFAKPRDFARGDYLRIQKGENVYTYSLEFARALIYDPDTVSKDFKGRVLRLQGRNYTITRAVSKSGTLSEIQLEISEAIIQLTADQEFLHGNHIIKVIGTDSSQSRCLLNVNGEQGSIREDGSSKIGGLPIRVVDVITRHRVGRGDICLLSFDNRTLALKDQSSILLNGKRIEGSSVKLLGEGGEWEGFAISFIAGQEDRGINADDVYIAPQDSWIDPVFGSWKLMFEGIFSNLERLEFKSAGRTATFTYTNSNQKRVVIPFYYNEGLKKIKLGRASRPLLRPGESLSGTPEHVQLLYTDNRGDTRILEVTDISCTERREITIQDKTTGSILARQRPLSECDSSIQTISLGSLGMIQLALGPDTIEFIRGGHGDFVPKSRYRSSIQVSEEKISITEKTGQRPSSLIEVLLSYNQEKNRIEVGDITDDSASPVWVSGQKGDSTKMAVTDHGTKLQHTMIEFIAVIPEELKVYTVIAPLRATIIPGAEGSVVKDVINQIPSNVTVLDSETGKLNKNMIVIGGPCANSIAANLLGNPDPCTKDFTSGKGMIQSITKDGRSYVIVAGYRAEDTRAAALVLSQYIQFKPKGSKVEVRTDSVGGPTIVS